MISKITYVNLFSLFLENLKVNTSIKLAPNGYKANRGNASFRLIRSTNTIVLKEKVAIFDNYDGYTKKEQVYVYKIVQENGDIKILDENGRSVLKITSDHAIVRVIEEKKKQECTSIFVGSQELLKYKEPQLDDKRPALF